MQILRHSGGLRQHRRHQQRRGQRIAAGRNVAAHRIERPYNPAEFPAWRKLFESFAREAGALRYSRMFSAAAAAACPYVPRHLVAEQRQAPLPEPERADRREAVELPRVMQKRSGHPLAGQRRESAVPPRSPIRAFVLRPSINKIPVREVQNSDHSPTSQSCSADIRRCLALRPLASEG